MFVSAFLWIIAGAVVFSSEISGDPPRFVHTSGTLVNVASANAAFTYGSNPSAPAVIHAVDTVVSDRSTTMPWEGPYYVENHRNTPAIQQEVVVEEEEPWYVQVFGGFGAIIHNLIPGKTQSAYSVPVTQAAKAGKPMPPACTISIIPNSVAYGGSATVTWTSRNADHVVFQGIGEVAPSGSLPVAKITSTRALALAVVGAEGLSSSCYTVVNVEPVVVEQPSCVISAHPSTIHEGESIKLSWGAQNTEHAVLEGHGGVPAMGGIELTPVKTTTYTLTVQSEFGDSAACDTEVTVTGEAIEGE